MQGTASNIGKCKVTREGRLIQNKKLEQSRNRAIQCWLVSTVGKGVVELKPDFFINQGNNIGLKMGSVLVPIWNWKDGREGFQGGTLAHRQYIPWVTCYTGLMCITDRCHSTHRPQTRPDWRVDHCGQAVKKLTVARIQEGLECWDKCGCLCLG